MSQLRLCLWSLYGSCLEPLLLILLTNIMAKLWKAAMITKWSPRCLGNPKLFSLAETCNIFTYNHTIYVKLRFLFSGIYKQMTTISFFGVYTISFLVWLVLSNHSFYCFFTNHWLLFAELSDKVSSGHWVPLRNFRIAATDLHKSYSERKKTKLNCSMKKAPMRAQFAIQRQISKSNTLSLPKEN